MRVRPDFDVVIAGGGLTGASLALALAPEAERIALIEAVSPASENQHSFDDRGLALALSSQRILQGLGVWEEISSQAIPVEHIHVSDRHHFGMVRLHADDLHLPALGYVVKARVLGQALMRKISAIPNIEFICPAVVTNLALNAEQADITLTRDGQQDHLTGRLLVAADGAHSSLRAILGITAIQKNYNQTAIVSSVTPEQPHGNTAWERFTPEGPVALLPQAENRCVLVFTVPGTAAARYLAMDEGEFLSCLRSRFSARLGEFRSLGPRKSYPLHYLVAAEQARERVVLLGNTAHMLHPNGAQGFNLCLRDVAGLAEILLPVLRRDGDPGAFHLLQQYVANRQTDQKRVACLSDGLATLFYNDLPHRIMLRNFGMLFLSLCPPGRRLLARMGTGLYGRQPALVRGVA